VNTRVIVEEDLVLSLRQISDVMLAVNQNIVVLLIVENFEGRQSNHLVLRQSFIFLSPINLDIVWWLTIHLD
jgi:hypothetical protein